MGDRKPLSDWPLVFRVHEIPEGSCCFQTGTEPRGKMGLPGQNGLLDQNYRTLGATAMFIRVAQGVSLMSNFRKQTQGMEIFQMLNVGFDFLNNIFVTAELMTAKMSPAIGLDCNRTPVTCYCCLLVKALLAHGPFIYFSCQASR